MKINGELGKVLSTSPEHKQWNCGMGIFKPGVVYWEENPEGRVIIDGKKSKILSKTDYDKKYVLIDGKNYKTVKIGDLVWMAENLAYVWEGLTRSASSDGDNPVYIETAFDEGGLFYNGIALDYLVKHPELLPAGWRVPTRRDFEKLISSTGLTTDPKKLVVPNDYIEAGFPLDFGGTNEYGFNGLPLGSYVSTNINYNVVAAWWTSTKVTPGDDESYYYLLRMVKDGFSYLAYTWSNRYNIRLVKDA